MSVNSTNPSTLFGGTWQKIEGRFLIGVGKNTDDNNETREIASGQAHGEYNHTLTVNEMPSHSHTISGGDHHHRLPMRLDDKDSPQNLDFLNYDGWGWGSYYNTTKHDGAHNHDCSSAGANWKHNNMPPYLGVYMWKRTA